MKYSLLEAQHRFYSEQNAHKLLQRSNPVNLLVNLSKITGLRDTPLLQLLIFSKVKNYIRFITLRQVYIHFSNMKYIKKVNSMNDNIFFSFMELGSQLDLIRIEDGAYILNIQYYLDSIQQEYLISFENAEYPRSVKELANDYFFMENLISANPDSKVGKIMNKKDYVYIKEVLTYLKEINNLNFTRQITPTFSEDFYTDLGELAFDIYTKKNYIEFINGIDFHSILDIGCGNGNYIDLYLQFPNTKIVGVERQKKVYETLLNKYRQFSNVVIHNNDIGNLSFKSQFDMINMSYMLFYLTYEEKVILFKKLKEILHKDGSIIICQYYPNFELYQELIARHNKKWGPISRYKYDIANSILQAEVVLNNMLEDFAQAEQWNPFLDLLDLCGFKISEISPADETYYSYFIEIKHK